MKTFKLFSIGFLVCAALSTSSFAQTYVTFNAGVIAPYGYPPGGGYVQVYGAPVMNYSYGGGYNNGYYANRGYYVQPPYRGGYYCQPHYRPYHHGYHHCY
jgi:hypothetical protein